MSGEPRETIDAPEFDLALTLDSGQVFHWQPHGKGYVGLIDAQPVYVEQNGSRLRCAGAAPDRVSRYFALDHPLPEICATFPSDASMAAAREFSRGMRIIRQPAWECLATFITSAMKQVAHIRQMSQAIRRTWGKPVRFDGVELFTYPPPERLAVASEAELRACKLGFRAKNLLGTARMISSGEVNLDSLRELDDEHALHELCRLPGVGEKVANCVLLFAFERLRAFPIDVWIGRVLRELYFARRRKVTPRRLREFSHAYFGEYGGYAQQYLFHHARQTWRRAKRGARA